MTVKLSADPMAPDQYWDCITVVCLLCEIKNHKCWASRSEKRRLIF